LPVIDPIVITPTPSDPSPPAMTPGEAETSAQIPEHDLPVLDPLIVTPAASEPTPPAVEPEAQEPPQPITSV
jgi:hypothetical protein